MSNTLYEIGSAIRLSAEFKDEAGVLADPINVTLNIKSPSNALTTQSVTKTAVGKYTCVFIPDAFGTWNYRFSGTGNVTAAAEGVFYVDKSQVLI